MIPKRLQFPLVVLITALFSFWIGRYSVPRNVATPIEPPKSLSQSPKSPRSSTPLVAPKNATSPMVSQKVATSADIPSQTENGWLAKLVQEGVPKLTVAQLERYLTENGRSAESLITASRLTGDLSLLREAAKRFPNDPQTHFELALKSSDPAEKLAALKAFAAADPDNGLGNYLAANAAFASGDTTAGLRLLSEAATRSGINSYTMTKVQATEEAYIASGMDPLKAKAAAQFYMALPEMTELRDLSKEMVDLRERYLQGGDTTSAATISEMTIALGRKLQSSGDGSALSELVGQSIERQALKQLDPQTSFDETGLTVAQRMDQLAARKDFIAKTVQGVDPTTSNISPQVLSQYLDRQKALGEIAALQWLRGRLGLQQP